MHISLKHNQWLIFVAVIHPHLFSHHLCFKQTHPLEADIFSLYSIYANIYIKMCIFAHMIVMEVCISASMWVCDIWFPNQSHTHVIVRATSINWVYLCSVYMCVRERKKQREVLAAWFCWRWRKKLKMKTLSILVLCSLAVICLTSGKSCTIC